MVYIFDNQYHSKQKCGIISQPSTIGQNFLKIKNPKVLSNLQERHFKKAKIQRYSSVFVFTANFCFSDRCLSKI